MHKPETRKMARDLFVESCMRYEDVARKTKVSPSQLKEWSRVGAWVAQRKEFQETVTSLNGKILETMRVVVDRIAAAYENDAEFFSQNIYAHGKAIESLVIMAAYTGGDLKPVIEAIAALRKNPGTAPVLNAIHLVASGRNK